MNLQSGRSLIIAGGLIAWSVAAHAQDPAWVRHAQNEFPKTDFTNRSIDLGEIMSGGPPRDGIPPVDHPMFVTIGEVADLEPTEPVVGLVLNGEARAYPLRILIWHEIANDVVGGVPVSVTYCPLCNTAVVFDRRVGDLILDFGTTGRLRNSDLVMYDRQTESWWQQFTGEALIGRLTGTRLNVIPARLESFAKFSERAPDGLVMVPNGRHARQYGRTPYAGYDTSPRPFLYRGPMPTEVAPLSRVVRVGQEAWSLALLRSQGKIERGDLRLTWSSGQNSAMDQRQIAAGADVGNVVVQRNEGGTWRDTPYSVDFAFAFRAFYPDSPIYLK